MKTEMGRYREINGDLLELASQGIFDIVGHGCNCHKTMGAGIAAQIAHRWPQAYGVDKMDERTPTGRLGDMTTSRVIVSRMPIYNNSEGDLEGRIEAKEVLILNLYTQLYPGRDLSIPALRLCLKKVNIFYSGRSIGLPLIGCGIAGGDWLTVKDIIIEELKGMDVTIVHYSKNLIKGVPGIFNQRIS